ncbi:MAG: ATP-binding protein, partial [Cytophagales bacterium]|nr:ATP-binding protein [Cytophagales bacterium]
MSETTKTPLSFDGEHEWLETLIHYRTQNPDACLMEVGEAHASGISAVPHDAPGEYACFVREHPFDWKTRSLLLMALAPVLRPRSMAKMIGPGNCFRLYQTPEGLYLPTGESWLYLLGGNRVEDRLDLLELLDEQCFLFRENVLVLADVPKHFSSSYGILKAEESWEDRFQFNRLREPSFSPSFPAHRLTAALDWEDLLLNGKTRSELRELMAYFQHEQTLRKDFGLDKHMRRGFRALFHGPSGTGKSLTAALIGKQLRQPVYRVDLSRLVSKYVGETSKNLERLFRKAEGKKWILFFDEGDVLLNKRTGNS